MPDHTLKKFDAELEEIRAKVLQMGGLVEEQITRALEALTTGNVALAHEVMNDDYKVNALEVSIDEECSTVIALRQPTAKDLRMVMTVVKTITDLERIGDEAAKIARMTHAIFKSGGRPTVPRVTDIEHVAEIALGMLRNALDAFARLDLAVAAKVVRQDEQVDKAFVSIFRQLITFMMEDPRTISPAIDILFIAKAIERIGDHAKNMSEYVVYLVKGKDVRHTSIENLEREALG
ncbi:MAG: transcriptional regulator PhoU [Proteobacteria bacterium]|jgi:phosphate transport system protein|nr:transcriptional regulator PhoU [Pseudomonadota bacterium]RPJ45895.1 MAG: phosphate signaling complex protein PhoU [Betaproteobacteria bacterium]